MTRPYCIQIQPGQPSTPPCAGEWIQAGDALYPADAATARTANLAFPRPTPVTAPAPAAVPAAPPPAVVATVPATPTK